MEFTYIPITYCTMCQDVEPGEKISVATRLYCNIRNNGCMYSEVYNLMATVTAVNRAYDGVTVEFDMDAEHPLLLDERYTESIECCTFELDLDIGDDFQIDIPIQSPECIIDRAPHHTKQLRHKDYFSRAVNDVYHEAMLDPHVAARVLTTGDGITTRTRFYPST